MDTLKTTYLQYDGKPRIFVERMYPARAARTMLWVGEKGARVRRRTRREERRRLTRRREVEAPTEPPRPNTKTYNQESRDT